MRTEQVQQRISLVVGDPASSPDLGPRNARLTFQSLGFLRIEHILDAFEQRLELGNIQKYAPGSSLAVYDVLRVDFVPRPFGISHGGPCSCRVS